LETDVVNEYFKRDSNAGKLTITSELNGAEAELDYSYNLYNGLAHLNLTLPAQARRGDKLHLKIEVGDPTMLEPFVNEAELSVQAAQAVSTGQNGRRSSSSDETDHSDPVQRPSGISFPKITEVAREDWRPRHMDEFSALRIEQVEAQDESQGVPLYDFFVNVDNIHLKHEEKIAPADAAALKAQFLYGMVLIGLGILKQTFQPPKRTSGVAEAENTAQVLTDPEAVVAHATDAIAPMLLPMIHVLGGIDVEDLSNYVESPGEFLEV